MTASNLDIGEYMGLRLKKRTLADILAARTESPIPGVSGNLRERQRRQIAAQAPAPKTPERKKIDRNLVIAAVSMGLAACGRLLYPPLTLLSLPGILYLTHYSVTNACQKLFVEKKITVDLVSALAKVLLILGGYIFIAGFSVFLYTLNRKLLSAIGDDSKKNLIDVFKQHPGHVWIARDGIEREIPFEALQAGDIVVVEAGAAVPCDGVIREGAASIDQHILTGEFQPVDKGVGEEVFALTLVLSGKIYVQANKTGQETTAAQIAEILNNTIGSKTDVQLWSQEFTDKTVLPTLALSGLSLPLFGPVSAMVIINSHFKYRATICSAIGVMSYLNAASRNGILIKDGHTFELLSQVDTVVFDKTGTLTEERPRIAHIHAAEGWSEIEALRYAAAAEAKQTHPVAKAILHHAASLHLPLPEAEEAAYAVGFGIAARVAGRVVRVGSLRFLEQESVAIPEGLRRIQADREDYGPLMVAVAIDDIAVGLLEMEASLRPGAQALIGELREHGIRSTYIISGDREAPTRRLARELGIDHYFAETLPERKADLIAQLQAEGKTVCYIGDGVNDSIALKQADVSISIRGASAIATDTAQIVLMDQTLAQLPYLFGMGRQFGGHMKKVVAAVVIPSFVAMGGAILFFHFTLLQSLILPQIGLIAGVVTALRPPARSLGRTGEERR
jgi:Cu2+-exporting ATPase